MLPNSFLEFLQADFQLYATGELLAL